MAADREGEVSGGGSVWSERMELPDGAPPGTVPNRLAGGLTLRSFLVAVVLTVVCGIWVRQAEIVVLSTQVSESVPPVPALACLLLLVVLNPLLRRIGRWFAFSQAEMLAVYCFLTISVSVAGVGVVRFWLALQGPTFYFQTEANQFASLQRYFPDWLVIKDPRVVRDLYARSMDGSVPWRAWLPHLAIWTAFFLALWLCMLSLIVLVRRRWIDSERLSFPIVALPMELTTPAGLKAEPRFLRDPLMWAGFGLAAFYNLLNILHALFPAVPAPGVLFDASVYMANPPLKSLQPVELWYRPDLIGFGFLVPLEICFSIWFFYAVAKAEGLFAVLYARDIPGMPFAQEQSIGAFLTLGLAFLWQARPELTAAIRGFRFGSRSTEQAAPRWAVVGLAGSFAFVCWFCTAAGMHWWAAVAYLGVVLVTALVCGRIRAEAGIPLIWLFPFYQQKKLLLYTLGTKPFLAGGAATLTIFALMTFLSRGYFPSLIGYQIESLKMADEARMRRSRMCATVVLAVVVGLAVAYWIHLAPYYRYGGANLRGGIWGTEMAVQEYTDVIAARDSPTNPDIYRTMASVAGAGVTALLMLLRRSFVGFPLHPIGYAVSTAYGNLVWWPFFLVWLAKWAILRLGGMRIYRRAIPFFLGFALGHFFAAGMVWGLLGALWHNAGEAYQVWFG